MNATAKLIGESSGGMTAVEICEDGKLVWSHRWFDDGCSTAGYLSGLRDAIDCMRRAADWSGFDGGEYDEDGDPVSMDDGSTTGVMLVYDTSSGWALGEDARAMGGQSSEIVDALMIAGIIPSDGEENGDDDIVAALQDHIVSQQQS